MHVARVLLPAGLAALLALLALACRGGDGDDAAPPPDPANDFAARVLQIGEPVGVTLDTRDGDLVSGLQAILNPEAVATIGRDVEDGGDRLALIAETAGMTADEFRAAWEADRGDAFARFASGLRDADDPDAIRDELFIEIAALPVHPEGVLVGSGRIDNPDGSQRYFLVFDLVGEPAAVERTITRQLDQSPWQVTGGQSSEEIAIVQFQSTTSADIQGAAWVQPIASSATLEAAARAAAGDDADGEDAAAAPEGPLSGLLYLIQSLPPEAAEPPEFALPESRPLPPAFPAAFLVDDGMTVTGTAWSTQPGATAFRVTALVAGSGFDLAESYRERIEAEGWELTGDEAVGFATVLGFASEADGIEGRVEIDAFEEDEGYTEVVITVQVSSRSSSE